MVPQWQGNESHSSFGFNGHYFQLKQSEICFDNICHMFLFFYFLENVQISEKECSEILEGVERADQLRNVDKQ